MIRDDRTVSLSYGGSTLGRIEASHVIAAGVYLDADGHVAPGDLAKALDGIVPGFTAAYLKPVEVPTGLGAVVETEDGTRYVLDGAQYTDGTAKWWTESGHKYVRADTITAILREGGKVLAEGVPA